LLIIQQLSFLFSHFLQRMLWVAKTRDDKKAPKWLGKKSPERFLFTFKGTRFKENNVAQCTGQCKSRVHKINLVHEKLIYFLDNHMVSKALSGFPG
jgi:hypothetical protein